MNREYWYIAGCTALFIATAVTCLLVAATYDSIFPWLLIQ